MSAEPPECARSAKAAITSTPLKCQRRRHNATSEERLLRWELCHGFLGVYQGKSIYRKCACGRPTTCLAKAECRVCMGMVRINQRFECRRDGCGGHARKGWGMLCRPCWVAEDPERAARVLREWEEEKGFAGVFYSSHIARKCACGKRTRSLDQATCFVCTSREAKIASGFKPKHPTPTQKRVLPRCTNGCKKDAKYAMRTLCEQCYVQADPQARGCPRCKRNMLCRSREDRLCWNCTQYQLRGAEGRRRKSEVSRDVLFDVVSAADLEDALGGHLGQCVLVD